METELSRQQKLILMIIFATHLTPERHLYNKDKISVLLKSKLPRRLNLIKNQTEFGLKSLGKDLSDYLNELKESEIESGVKSLEKDLRVLYGLGYIMKLYFIRNGDNTIKEFLLCTKDGLEYASKIIRREYKEEYEKIKPIIETMLFIDRDEIFMRSYAVS